MSCRWEHITASLLLNEPFINIITFIASVSLSSLSIPLFVLKFFHTGQSSLSSRCGYSEHTCRLHRLGVSGAHHLQKLSAVGNVVFAAEWTAAAAGGCWVSTHRHQPEGESLGKYAWLNVTLKMLRYYSFSPICFCSTVTTVWYLNHDTWITRCEKGLFGSLNSSTNTPVLQISFHDDSNKCHQDKVNILRTLISYGFQMCNTFLTNCLNSWMHCAFVTTFGGCMHTLTLYLDEDYLTTQMASL